MAPPPPNSKNALQTLLTATTLGAQDPKCDSVGVIIPDPGSPLFADSIIPRLLTGIDEVLCANEIQMVLFAPRSLDRLERYLARGHVDAVIMLTVPESGDLPARLEATALPVVYGGRPGSSRPVAYVDVDDHAGARIATEHLIEQGRRRIVHIAGPQHAAPASRRLQGFRDAMWNAALRSDLVEHGALDRDSGEMAMSRLLNRTEDIDGVFAASDAMAAGAMWAMQILGRRVPDDVAIIGYDDSPLAATTSPPLSSVRRPIEDMGREMARLSLDMATKAAEIQPRQFSLDPALAIRESSRQRGDRGVDSFVVVSG